MKKMTLLTPGPTMIPPQVLAALSQPIIHHRTKDFEQIFQEVRKKLQWLFETKQEVLSIAATGSGGMEAALVNLCSPGDVVITINAGKFGERWTKIAKAYGLQVNEIFVTRGEALDLSVLEEKLSTLKSTKAVFFQASETSTGVMMPTEAIAKICAKFNSLCVCDAITACGVFPLPMDAWGIDVLITASQKALMLPPGLAFIAYSERAWKTAAQAKLPKFYFDLNEEKKWQAKNQSAWTPAISLIVAADISLGMMIAEGREKMFARHLHLASATRNAVRGMGLELFSKAPSTAVTTVMVPKTIHDGKMIPTLMRDRFGVIIAGGQDDLEGKIIRLSHFGYCSETDLMLGISALECVCHSLGHSFELGSGMKALFQSLI